MAESRRLQIKYGLFISIMTLLTIFFGGTRAFASVTEGKAGASYQGKYVVIVNTSDTRSESTGAFTFSDAAAVGLSEQNDAGSPAAQLQTDTGSGSGKFLQTADAASVTTSYQIGSQKNFYTYSGTKTFTCIGIGSHCYIWMENSLKAGYETAGKLELIASDMARTYDGKSYETLNAMSGGKMAFRDGSGKLSIVLEKISNASGVYMGSVREPSVTAIHINTPEASSYRSGEMSSRNGLLVHEGQHALFEQFTGFKTNDYLWLNEAMSVAAMEYLWGGSDSSNWLEQIPGNTSLRNGVSMIYSKYRGENACDYAMPYLFLRYLVYRFQGEYDPMSFFQKVYSVSAAGISPAEFVGKVTGVPMGTLLLDFYTAIAATESSGIYGFGGDVLAQKTAASYPVYMGGSGSAVTLEPTAALVLKLEEGSVFTVPSDAGSDIRYRIIDGERVAAAPSGGAGTKTEPYVITSLKELNLMGNRPGAYYRLGADIAVNGKNFVTVEVFTGTLDGAGHRITGLKQPLTGKNQGTIQNLRITADLQGVMRDYQGVIARENAGLIDNCSVEGSAEVGVYGTYTAVGAMFGGIAGINTVAGLIQNCTSGLSVTAEAFASKTRVGGIVGGNSGTVQNCCYRGKLHAASQGSGIAVYAGGIAGESNRDYSMGGLIKNCINYGSVTAASSGTSGTEPNAWAGQICGLAAQNLVSMGLSQYISNCYGKTGCGPLVGYPDEKISGSDTLTEDEMKDPSTFNGWDFDTEWTMGEGGPVIRDLTETDTVEVQNAPSRCYLGTVPANWGTLCINGSGYVKITDRMVSGFDSSREGTTVVRVNWKGRILTYPVTITAPQNVTGLTVRTMPSKTGYTEGEKAQLSGMILTAALADGSQILVSSGYTWETKALQVTDKVVLVNYCGKTVSVGITVTKAVKQSMTVSAKLEKTDYASGQPLDLSNIRVQLTYSNGTKSPLLAQADFEKYGIHLAKGASVSETEGMSFGKPLQSSDNGKYIYLYADDRLPSQMGSVYANIGKISVSTPLAISGTEILMTRNRPDCYGDVYVSGGSGQYETTVVSEKLPAGVKRNNLPGSYNPSFTYTGTATAPEGSYTSRYTVRDTVTGAVLNAEITITVQASDQVRMLSFELVLNERVIRGNINHEKGTIDLTVPAGTNVTKLTPTIDYGANAGADCNYWNGTSHDFTNPVKYILTAPDGVTRKSYLVTVHVESGTGETGGGNTGETGGGNTGGTGGSTGGTGGGNTGTKPTPAPHKHTAGTWVTTKAPTIFRTGEQKLRCKGCKAYIKTRKIAKLKASVTLNAKNLPLQVKKSTTVLKVAKKDSLDSIASWSSSNPTVVKVNAKTGKITAGKKAGTAYVTVKMKSGASAKCQIKVQKKKVTTKSIKIAKKTVVLKKGKSYQITAEKNPLTSTDKITYKSSKKTIATVNSKGKVVAKKKGTAYITVKSGKKKVNVKIVVTG